MLAAADGRSNNFSDSLSIVQNRGQGIVFWSLIDGWVTYSPFLGVVEREKDEGTVIGKEVLVGSRIEAYVERYGVTN